eukprot:TRINITY_DN18687_c0_g1::TRINITY_DN18687_c0_g1_i1::g.20507::m.20507 TRINITY_DN18687_c0_g1::TRINITY_DN18687_c0_g1_i1::g.20507  ORF type:complete len:190 (+),score=11.69,Gly-zipper_OmpA/PF13436.1/0.0039,Bax1-I/PF01027.15/0.035,Bacteriocin_IIc/PF10439.4/4.2 TRINITY_DN18687_c0_g1_i1:72-572(+)
MTASTSAPVEKTRSVTQLSKKRSSSTDSISSQSSSTSSLSPSNRRHLIKSVSLPLVGAAIGGLALGPVGMLIGAKSIGAVYGLTTGIIGGMSLGSYTSMQFLRSGRKKPSAPTSSSLKDEKPKTSEPENSSDTPLLDEDDVDSDAEEIEAFTLLPPRSEHELKTMQ